MTYAPDVSGLTSSLGLRFADPVTNVRLLEPRDDVVFAWTSLGRGPATVARPQLAVGLIDAAQFLYRSRINQVHVPLA